MHHTSTANGNPRLTAWSHVRSFAVPTSMSINDGGIALPSARFPTVWFKGGSEPGVLTLSYLVRRDDGTLLTASAMLSDPENALDEATAAPQVLAVLRGALQLA